MTDSPQMIAALYVIPDGVYSGRADVDLWPEARDARKYAGPFPVVAHPPCERWCRMAPLVQKTHGYRVGDDGGCFEHALACVRAFGGVIEHPAASYAFARFGLTSPPKEGRWISAGDGLGWVCCVEQGNYSHRARKATWLYSVGCMLPDLHWGKSAATAYVTDGGGDVKRRWSGNVDPLRKRLGKREASSTPSEFANMLLDIARTAYDVREAKEAARMPPEAKK